LSDVSRGEKGGFGYPLGDGENGKWRGC